MMTQHFVDHWLWMANFCTDLGISILKQNKSTQRIDLGSKFQEREFDSTIEK